MPKPIISKDGTFEKSSFSATRAKSAEDPIEPPPVIFFPDRAIEKLKQTSDHSEGLTNPTFHQKVMRSKYHKETYGPDTSLIVPEE